MSVVEAHADAATAVGYIELNRPEKRNALSAEMRSLLFSSVKEFGQNPDVSTIHLSGAGPTFCAGVDLVEGASVNPPANRTAVSDWKGIRELIRDVRAFREVPVPIVVAIQGHSYGMATLMATCADVVIVAEDALIGAPRVGGGTGYQGPLMDFVTLGRKARELELRYGQFTGKQAAEIGWANYAVPAAELQDFSRDFAKDLARQSRDVLEIRKASMNYTQDLMGFSQAMELTAVWDSLGHASQHTRQLYSRLAADGLQALKP